ncbi:MAG: circadian clock protein KaiC [Sedimenticola sp.]
MTNQSPPEVPATPLPKIATGIRGLDEILLGGLPEGRTSLVSGGPGCGKSVLGMEWLYRGALAGEPALWVTFEETADAVRRNALTFGWDLAPLEADNRVFVFSAQLDPQAVHGGDFDLKGMMGMIGGKAAQMGAKRIMIDAIDALLRVFNDMARERNELYSLHRWLQEQGMTTLLSVKSSPGQVTTSHYEFLDYMVDCVLHLDQRVNEQISTRRLRVIKYRGSGFGRNEYPYVIGQGGMTLLPTSTMELEHRPMGERISSGHDRLDGMLGGGYQQGANILIAGSSGTGKTTLACTFVRAACERGERVLYINFEESAESMMQGMLSPGINLAPASEAGLLRIITAMPESLGVEEHLLRAIDTIDEFAPAHLVVDAISATERMGSEQGALDFMMRLIAYSKARGITMVMNHQTQGIESHEQISGMGISSLVDTVLFIQYVISQGEMNRTLMVLKSRGAAHSNQYRELIIGNDGIKLSDVYVGEGGVLTGVARQEREAVEAVTKRKADLAVVQTRREVEKRKAALAAERTRLESELARAEADLEAMQLEVEITRKGRDIRAGMRGEEIDSTRISPADREETP